MIHQTILPQEWIIVDDGSKDNTGQIIDDYASRYSWRYICGYHPLFMLSKCIVHLVRRPYVIGSVGLMYGFISGYLTRTPQVADPAAIAYLRRQQMNRLLGAETTWK
jgi:glycosyltransferase involved in cell wall biosynthesis